jgi:hypothetical protein
MRADREQRPERDTKSIAQVASERSRNATDEFLRLQQTAGNQAVNRLIQTKLEVGAAGDEHEREADDVARQVINASYASPRLDDTESTPVRRAATSVTIGLEGGPVDADMEQQIERKRGGGKALPQAFRSSVEGAMNADFSGVRVHHDAESTALNDAMQARAFTTGSDIFVRSDQYNPGSVGGQELLAHELTHVVQQTGGAARSVVRRMPGPNQMVAATGQEPKEDKKIGIGKLKFTKEMSGRYKAVLDALGVYHTYLGATRIGTDNAQVQAQVKQINKHLQTIYDAARKYTKAHDQGPVATYCLDLMSKVGLERVMVAEIAGKYGRAPRTEFQGAFSPSWLIEIPADFRTSNTPTAPSPITAQQTGSGQGAQKSIPKVATQSGYSGYFAKDAKLSDMADQVGVGNMMEEYGIDTQNPRLAARSVAMSRLDKLLGAGVIANTEFAVRNGEFGTIMEDAGASGAKQMKTETDTTDPATDANLQRLLSRLQLIDAIAGQVDRHMGNYYVEKDNSGKVVAVTGIDLDMSFGTQGFAIDQKLKFDWYPGLSKYVDEDLAVRILNVKADDLRAIWTGLLTDNEIEAAIGRWEALKRELAKLKSAKKLLKPNQWNAKTAREMNAEQKSYVAHIMNAKGGSTDPKFAPE